MKMIEITSIRRHEGRVPIQTFGVEAAKAARAFHRTLPEYAPTPLVKLNRLAESLGVRGVLVKDERPRFGLNAFKALGGSYAMGGLVGPEPRTFVTATDGNHGRGVAWAARKLGQRAVVYLPRGTARERLENIRREGAEAEILDLVYDDVVRYARRQAEENGWVLVQDTAWEGYEDIPTRIMQGYATIGLELTEQLEGLRPTHVFLQAGVGSMAGAMAGFLADAYGEDRPRIVVVEPFRADCVFRTAAADDGALHACPGALDSIMAGLNCGEPCPIAWDVLSACGDFALRMDDCVAALGMRALAAPLPGDTPIVSGESGAAGFGAALALLTDDALRGEREALGLDEQSVVLCVSTEGDTDPVNYRDVVWRGKYGY